jgi:hypothetical protein
MATARVQRRRGPRPATPVDLLALADGARTFPEDLPDVAAPGKQGRNRGVTHSTRVTPPLPRGLASAPQANWRAFSSPVYRSGALCGSGLRGIFETEACCDYQLVEQISQGMQVVIAECAPDCRCPLPALVDAGEGENGGPGVP